MCFLRLARGVAPLDNAPAIIAVGRCCGLTVAPRFVKRRSLVPSNAFARLTHPNRTRVRLLAASLLCLAAASCNQPTIMVENEVVRLDKPTPVTGYVHRKVMFPFLQDVKDIDVAFQANQVNIGTAKTNADGKAETAASLPQSGDVIVSARAKVDGKDIAASARAYHWRPDRVVIVVDVDNTICETVVEKLIFGGGKEPTLRPIADSKETMVRLAQQYEILYVTARPRRVLEATREWLDKHGFPPGPVLTAPGVGPSLKPTETKIDIIGNLKKDWPNILIGIGNSATDAQAYGKCGMLTLILRPDPKDEHGRHAIFMSSWYNIARFFDANQSDLTNPAALKEIIAGRKLITIPAIPYTNPENEKKEATNPNAEHETKNSANPDAAK